jgi:adenylosuccinate synthase
VTDASENRLRNEDRGQVEQWASGLLVKGRGVGDARAELVRRNHAYAEEQENSRREFELKLETIRTEREKDRQQFEASLAADNREVAKEAARIQATATREVAEKQLRIARAATSAAIAAAIAAFLSVAVTTVPIIKAAWFPQSTAAQAPSSGATSTTHQ